MRRGNAAALRFDTATAPPASRLTLGPRGLRLAEVEPPPGFSVADDLPLHLVEASPVPGAICVAADQGRVALVARPGILVSLGLPELNWLHERRPPGLDGLQAAAGRNVALLHAEGGWRVVVLPSLGDIDSDLGEGHAAIRPDGQRVAIAGGGLIQERSLPDGEILNEIAGPADGLVYSADGHLLTAAGGEIGRPGCAVEAGSEIDDLAASSVAHVGAARHHDGHVSVWATDGCDLIGSFPAPFPAPLLSLWPDGSRIVLGSGAGERQVVAVLRCEDGALLRWIEGARAATPLADDGLLITGDFGVARLGSL